MYDHILVAVDFSDASRHALQRAVSIARQLGSRVSLVHVLALGEDDPAWAAEQWKTFVPDELASDVGERHTVRALKPELGVLHTAREVGADLIVIGTHGRTGLSHMFLGSVAERVVQLAPCPVLTVREPGRTFEAPTLQEASS